MTKTVRKLQLFQIWPSPESDNPRGGGGGGGGYFHMYAYWVCAARETPFFSPEFPFWSISFSQITKKSVPEHHHFTFFGGFCHSGDHHFQNFFNFNPFIASHGRLSPHRGLAAGHRAPARRVLAVPETSIFTLKMDQARPEPRIFKLKTAHARSGAPHFHARSGALAHF